MNEMTLREMCDTFGVSRRAVQGYEKARLVSASRKNTRGYLLYDEAVQERVKRIKLFQQMGFTIKQIKELIDAPDNILKPALEERLQKLTEEKKNIEILIHQLRVWIKEI